MHGYQTSATVYHTYNRTALRELEGLSVWEAKWNVAILKLHLVAVRTRKVQVFFNTCAAFWKKETGSLTEHNFHQDILILDKARAVMTTACEFHLQPSTDTISKFMFMSSIRHVKEQLPHTHTLYFTWC